MSRSVDVRASYRLAATTLVLCCSTWAATSPAPAAIYSMLNSPAPSAPPAPEFEMSAPESGATTEVLPSQTAIDRIFTSSEYLGRAAVVADDTRLADFALGNFLPSAIPVVGQPFFGAGTRANVQGSGSAIRINGYSEPLPNVRTSAHAELMLKEFTIPQGDSSSDGASLAVRQVYGTWNRLSVGVMDTAFSDPSALPETLDLAGPNARITAYDAGVGDGQGRLSYDLLSDEPEGFEIVTSIEQAIPEITTLPDNDETLARYPDFVCALQYVNGYYEGEDFYEYWHLQWASVARDVGFESPDATDEHVFGWGTAFSGAYAFSIYPEMRTLDRVVFSVVYGEGISHYITDLNAAGDTGDAVINADGDLEAQPAFGWYAGYTHNWTDYLRSTASFSHVTLDSTTPLVATFSPYRSGDYVAINLLYHIGIENSDDAKGFYAGIEYLFGRKETLDDADGDAQRIMFVVALSK